MFIIGLFIIVRFQKPFKCLLIASEMVNSYTKYLINKMYNYEDYVAPFVNKKLKNCAANIH